MNGQYSDPVNPKNRKLIFYDVWFHYVYIEIIEEAHILNVYNICDILV